MEIYRITDQNRLIKDATSFIIKTARISAEERGRFSLVLAGGKTPEPLYRTLTSKEFRKRMPWDKSFFFWGDERSVSNDHPESNYRMVSETLLSHIPVSQTHIYPIPTSVNFEDAAIEYESTLRRFFKGQKSPSFDLIMLGIGNDGHVASLFKNDPALKEKERWVRAVRAPEEYTVRERITITLAIINSARNVMFLVTGEEKRKILSHILRGKGDYPAQLVHPAGRLCLFTDIKV